MKSGIFTLDDGDVVEVEIAPGKTVYANVRNKKYKTTDPDDFHLYDSKNGSVEYDLRTTRIVNHLGNYPPMDKFGNIMQLKDNILAMASGRIVYGELEKIHPNRRWQRKITIRTKAGRAHVLNNISGCVVDRLKVAAPLFEQPDE